MSRSFSNKLPPFETHIQGSFILPGNRLQEECKWRFIGFDGHSVIFKQDVPLYLQAAILADLLQDLPEQVEKFLRQEQSEDQRLWEGAAARILVASYEACQGEAKTLETLVKHVKPIAGWLRKTIAWRQQELENLWRARKETDSSFDPQAPSAEEVLDERLIMKVCPKYLYLVFQLRNGRRCR